MNKNNNPLQLTALAMAIGLTFTTSAYAGNDHRNGHDRNYSKNEIKSYLTAYAEPLAQGKIKLEQKRSKTEFSAEVRIPVPSVALSITNNTDATAATMFLLLSNDLLGDYAECYLDLNKIRTNRRTSSVYAEYKVKIIDRNGFQQGKIGVCDIDLATAGIQSGIPSIQQDDIAQVTIDTNNEIIGDSTF